MEKVGDIITGVVVSIWVAVTDSDTNDGSGHDVDHSNHLSQGAAIIASSKIGPMGTDGRVEPRLALHLSGGGYATLPRPITISQNPDERFRLRAEARKKLTPAELEALLGEL